MEEQMNKYSEIITLLENILANDLNVTDDYDVVEILNSTIEEIKECIEQ